MYISWQSSPEGWSATMVQILVLLLCLLVTSATGEYGWRPRQEYRFSVEGRTVAGIPSLKEQYSGIHFMGTLRVQAQSSEILLMKLQNMTFTKLHSHLPGGWWDDLPDAEQMYQEFPISNSPFIARLQKGVIERLVVSGNLATWEVNFVQAVVAHLQLDLSAAEGTQGVGVRSNKALGRRDSETNVFTVMENSVVGRCEVLYEVAPISMEKVTLTNPGLLSFWLPLCGKNRDFLEITKTRNYSRCEHISQSHFGLPPNMKCSPSGNKCGSFWSRASLSRTIGCGDRKDMILLNTVSSSRVLAAMRMQPEDTSRGRPDSQASVGTFLNLTLLSARAYGNRRFGQPTDPINIDGIRYQFSTSTPSTDTAEQTTTTTDVPNSEQRSSRSSPSKSTSTSSSEETRPTRRGKRDSRRKRPPPPTASPEVVNISPESDSRSKENAKPWGRDPHDDMSLPPLMPFSAFSLAHQEGEARACLVQQIKETINDIANDLEVPKMIPEKMTLEKIQIAIQMCRTMKYPELLRAVASIMDIQARETRTLLTERKLLRDVVLMCGTNPAFRIIKSWLEQQKVRGEAAAEMVAALPSYLLTPGPALVQQFYELVRSSASFEDQQVKISTVLAFSHLLRVACVSSEERKSRFLEPYEPCRPDSVTEIYLPYLRSQMRADPTLRRVYITAIGNTGAASAMHDLLSVARDKTASSYERALAIIASKYIVFRDPKLAMYTLLGFYHSSTYPTPVRIAALGLLLFTRPPLIVWQRIALNTWYEPNPAINAYVWSTLKTMATTQDTFYKDIAERAAAVLPLARAMPLGSHRPYNLVRTAVASGLHEVVLEQLSWSPDLTAANLYYRQTQRLGGLSRLQFEADFWMADADGFMSSFAEMLNTTGDMESRRPPIPDLPRSTSWIRETLKIAERELPRLEGHLEFKLGALHERMFLFDRKIVSSIEKAGRRLSEQLHTARPMLYQKMGETGFWLGSPNELGLPVQLRVNVPWSVRAKGEVNGPLDSSVIAADVSLSYSSQLIAELSVFTPFDCMHYVAGAQSHTFLQLPTMRLAARWYSEPSKHVEFSFSSLAQDEQILLFSQTSRPYTSQHDVISLAPISLAKSTVTVNVAPEVHSELLPDSRLMLHYSSEAPNHRWSPEPHWVLSYPALWPGLEAASLQLHATRPPPINVMLTLGHAKAEDGVVTITTEAEFSSSGPTPNVDSTTITPIVEPTTTTTVTPSITSVPESSTIVEPNTEASKPSDEQPDESTVMEEVFNTNLTILSSNVEDPTGDFNASTINLLNLEGNTSRHNYLLQQVLSKINSGQAYIVGVAIGLNHSPTPRYQLFWTLGGGRAKRFHRVGLFAVDDIDKWQFGLTSTLQTPAVPLLRLRSILDSNLTSNVFADFKYSEKNSEKIVSMKGSVMRTDSQTSFVRNHSLTLECLEHGLDVQPSCRRMAIEAGYLDHYNVTITYNEQAQQYGGPVHHYFSLVKHAMFPYLDEEESAVVEGEVPAQRVKLVLELSPQSRTAAVWMRSPSSEVELSGMPINPLLMQVLRVNPVMGLLPRLQDPSFCSMESDRMVTFDGTSYSYELGDCWHVIAKDCSGRSRVVVLARSLANRTELEVNLDNYKIVRLLPGGEALVNGREVDLARDQLAETYDLGGARLLELMASSDDTLQLRLPQHGLTILHSNDTVLIQAKAGLRGRLCGMCGDFDGEKKGDFRGPGGNLILTSFDFASSYALPSTSCRMSRYH